MREANSLKHNNLSIGVPVAEVPLSEYPRPQLKRDSYICLNGKWNDGVLVPFPLESAMAGRKKEFNGKYRYHRYFTIPSTFIKDKVILHFGAVDQIAKVYIDNNLVTTHEGGYLPFEVDITKFVKANKQQTLAVEIQDELSHMYPYGKQKKHPGGMWYTPVSGIWQTVWIESVSVDYISHLEITPSLNSVNINIESTASLFDVTVLFKGEKIFKGKFDSPYFDISIPNPKLWTPDEPNLYDIEISTEHDSISSYFGLRTLSIEKVNGVPRILLNGKQFFFHGVLDQGYFPEGIYTPNSYKVYEDDILRLKELGINTIRKHIKIEPALFYEACDRLGMIVFQDMVNNGKYSFIRDTALPTIGKKQRNDMKKRIKEEVKCIYEQSMEQTLDHLYHFPSICYYTLFNEGWGQFDSDIMYDIVKAMDRTRIIDSTSGWFWQSFSDVYSHHIYFKDVKINPDDRPIILSEFGGYSYKIPEHSFKKRKNYGYGKASSVEELTQKISELYEKQIIPAVSKGLCGAIYTQAYDIEEETNGLYTYDRKVCKVNPEKMLEIAKKLRI